MLEKRKYLRIPYRAPVYGTIQFVSELRDLSISGCFVETTLKLSEGTLMNLDFTLPNTPRIIRARGEVRWSGQYSSDRRTESVFGVGIKFLDIPVEDIAVISEFVKGKASIHRKFPRFAIEFPVSFGLPGVETTHGAKAMDLSLGGLFLQTDYVVDLDASVNLEFLLPNTTEAVKCAGKVVYVNKNIPDIFSGMIHGGMGIEFIDIDEKDLERIDRVLEDASKE